MHLIAGRQKIAISSHIARDANQMRFIRVMAKRVEAACRAKWQVT
jgi:hypothetical protein